MTEYVALKESDGPAGFSIEKIGANYTRTVTVIVPRTYETIAAFLTDHGLEMPTLSWDHNSNRYYEPVEKLAAEIYETFVYDGPGQKPAWAPHGNGLKADEARAEARERLRAAGHVPGAPV